MAQAPVIRVLGPVELVTCGKAVRLTRLEGALLALLVAHQPQTVSVGRIQAELWDGEPPDSARTRVQALVSSLRRRIGVTSAIRTRAPGYALVPGLVQLDAAEFEDKVAAGHRLLASGQLGSATQAFTEALQLWRGAAFDGVT